MQNHADNLCFTGLQAPVLSSVVAPTVIFVCGERPILQRLLVEGVPPGETETDTQSSGGTNASGDYRGITDRRPACPTVGLS